MKYYIIHPDTANPGNEDYKIMKVKEADEANFIEDYGHRVIVKGNSMMEAFINFEVWKQEHE
jgi:hypothetical protein